MSLRLDQRNPWMIGASWAGIDVCEELHGPFPYGGRLDFAPGFFPSTTFLPFRKACFKAFKKKKSFPAPNLSGRWKKAESFDWSKLSQTRRRKRLFPTFYGVLVQHEYAPQMSEFLMFHHRMHLRSTVLATQMSRKYGHVPRIRVKTFDSCCAHGTS